MKKRAFTPDRGQSLVEYALILVLVGLVVIIVLSLLGPAIGNVFSVIVLSLQPPAAAPSPPPECYGSLLLPIMVGTTGATVLVSYYLPILRKRIGDRKSAA